LHNSIPKGCCVQRNGNVPFAGFDPRATKGRLLLRAANANHRQLKTLEDGLCFSFFKRVSKFAHFQ
jgi:hypothetical protein